MIRLVPVAALAIVLGACAARPPVYDHAVIFAVPAPARAPRLMRVAR